MTSIKLAITHFFFINFKLLIINNNYFVTFIKFHLDLQFYFTWITCNCLFVCLFVFPTQLVKASHYFKWYMCKDHLSSGRSCKTFFIIQMELTRVYYGKWPCNHEVSLDLSWLLPSHTLSSHSIFVFPLNIPSSWASVHHFL